MINSARKAEVSTRENARNDGSFLIVNAAEVYRLVSVRNGVAGKPSWLNKFTSGVFAQP